MQAAYFRGNKVIELVDAPRPTPGPGEVLIRVAANGVCGADHKSYTGGFERIPGHEAAGTVVEVGAGVHLPVGSRVAAYIPLFCGECRFCREGRGNICAHRSGLLGWSTDGGYAEYMLLPERNALHLADETSFEEGVLLLDTLGTSGHALRVARYAEAESVLVIGAGPICIGAVALLQAWGMPRVYVSEFLRLPPPTRHREGRHLHRPGQPIGGGIHARRRAGRRGYRLPRRGLGAGHLAGAGPGAPGGHGEYRRRILRQAGAGAVQRQLDAQRSAHHSHLLLYHP